MDLMIDNLVLMGGGGTKTEWKIHDFLYLL